MKIPFFIAILTLCWQLAFSQLHEIRALQLQLPKIKDSIAKNDVLNRLAVLMVSRDPDSSYSYLRLAHNMAERMDYIRGVATAYKTYGVLLTGNNNYLAAQYLSNCLDKFRSIKDKEGESMALMNVANLMYLDNDSTNAYKYLIKSYQLTLMLSKDSVRSIIMNNINLHSPSYLNPEVNRMYQTGKSIALKYRDDRMILYFKLFEGYQLWERGQRRKALGILKSSLKTADSIGNKLLKLSIYYELASRYEMIDTAQSKMYYEQGLQEATTHNFTTYRVLFAKSLYAYFKNRRDNKEALTYVGIMLNAQQKHEDELKKYRFNVVNFVLMDKDLKITQEKEQKSTVLMTVFIFLSIIAIALLFFVFRSFQVSKRYAIVQRKLADETQAHNEELKNWNRFHDTLLSVLAHDLRQPFSSVIMTSQLFKSGDDVFSEDELKTIMLDLDDTASKSIELLEGLLCWVKSKKESFEYKTEPIILQNNLSEANGLYLYDQNNKQITLLNKVPEQLIVHAHRQMLLFINRNMISNATKYSPKGGLITIHTEIKDGSTIVAFSDQGPGMTKEQVERLFRIDETNEQERSVGKGAGIALSICYDMIQQMKGRLWVETEPTKGSTFYYSLPQ